MPIEVTIMNNELFSAVKPLTVSQLNYYIKSLLDGDMRLNGVFLSGEISNLVDHYKSGHIYLSLKDERSVIRAVMFSGNARRLQFIPQNGMKVIACGRVTVYEPTGQYQLYIDSMQPDGVGALAIAYEQLKQKLEKKGYFDSKIKKPIPQYPKSVGVITSPTGAAVQDIKTILTRRFPGVNIILAPVLVQGDSAPGQLVSAIKKMDGNSLADVIIIGRGGGSMEDLQAFNSEALADAVYNCKTPVISAVGHETDFTICDFVSDLRAPTPSAAAELAVPDKRELAVYYDSQRQYALSLAEAKLNSCLGNLTLYRSRLNMRGVTAEIDNIEKHLGIFREKLKKFSDSSLERAEGTVNVSASRLDGLNPLKTLKRGYSFIQKGTDVVYSVKELKLGDEFNLTLSDGTVQAEVTKV